MIECVHDDLVLSRNPLSWMDTSLNHNQVRVCLLTDTLAWAVTHRIPLPDALRSLPFIPGNLSPASPRKKVIAQWFHNVFAPFHPFFWLINLRWSHHIRSLIADLEKGDPLSSALERNLGRHFPSSFFMALVHAERHHSLHTTLPLLAYQVRLPSSTYAERTANLSIVASRVIASFQAMFFALGVALPSLNMIFDEIAEDSTSKTHFFPGINPDVFLTLITTFFVFVILLFFLHRLEGIGNVILHKIPVLGRQQQLFLLSDLARSMAVFLRHGEDLVTAAEWNLHATRSSWLRQRLQGFIRELQEGQPWLKAWSRLGFHRPLDNWVLTNAQARQDPAAGFELLSEWLHQEIQLTTRRLDLWIDPILTLFTGVAVLYVAWITFSFLTQILWSLM